MQSRAQRFTTRQRMQGQEFEVFHYRDRKPQNVGVHHHDFYEVYFFQGGKVNFRVQGKFYQLKPGDLLLINPHELHEAQVDADAQYERIVLWIDCNYLKQIGDGALRLDGCFDKDSPDHTNLLRPDALQRAVLQDQLEKLTSEFYSDRIGSKIYAQGLLLQLMVEINRLVQGSAKALVQNQEQDLISRVLSYIGSHYQEPITLQSLSEEFYVSRYYLSHEFSHRVGTSVYRYIMFKRLMQAKELMDQGACPGEVYRNCGFGDYANFFRAFKNEYGMSPKEYINR